MSTTPAPWCLGETGTLFSLSLSGFAEFISIVLINFPLLATLKFLNSALSFKLWETRATAPETWGVAIEVPLISTNPEPFFAEYICPPGAVKSGFRIPSEVSPQLEKLLILPSKGFLTKSSSSEIVICVGVFAFNFSPSSIDIPIAGIVVELSKDIEKEPSTLL